MKKWPCRSIDLLPKLFTVKYAATDPKKLVSPTSIVPVFAEIVAPPSYYSFIFVKILFEKIAIASIPVNTLKNVIATTT
jgi:hypothetical protein